MHHIEMWKLIKHGFTNYIGHYVQSNRHSHMEPPLTSSVKMREALDWPGWLGFGKLIGRSGVEIQRDK